MSLDKPEQIVADKRISRWPEEDRRWFDGLTEDEKELVRVLAAHLDAKPMEIERG